MRKMTHQLFFLMRLERLFNYHKLSFNPEQVIYSYVVLANGPEPYILHAARNQYIRETEIIE